MIVLSLASGKHVHEKYTSSNLKFYIVKLRCERCLHHFFLLLQNIDFGFSLEPPQYFEEKKKEKKKKKKKKMSNFFLN